jgi:hypothetical protein
VVAIAFQITFCAKMHANDVFSFFKNYFWHQHIKTIQNILNFSKKKLNFFGNAVCTAFPNGFNDHYTVSVIVNNARRSGARVLFQRQLGFFNMKKQIVEPYYFKKFTTKSFLIQFLKMHSIIWHLFINNYSGIITLKE